MMSEEQQEQEPTTTTTTTAAMDIHVVAAAAEQPSSPTTTSKKQSKKRHDKKSKNKKDKKTKEKSSKSSKKSKSKSKKGSETEKNNNSFTSLCNSSFSSLCSKARSVCSRRRRNKQEEKANQTEAEKQIDSLLQDDANDYDDHDDDIDRDVEELSLSSLGDLSGSNNSATIPLNESLLSLGTKSPSPTRQSRQNSLSKFLQELVAPKLYHPPSSSSSSSRQQQQQQQRQGEDDAMDHHEDVMDPLLEAEFLSTTSSCSTQRAGSNGNNNSSSNSTKRTISSNSTKRTSSSNSNDSNDQTQHHGDRNSSSFPCQKGKTVSCTNSPQRRKLPQRSQSHQVGGTTTTGDALSMLSPRHHEHASSTSSPSSSPQKSPPRFRTPQRSRSHQIGSTSKSRDSILSLSPVVKGKQDNIKKTLIVGSHHQRHYEDDDDMNNSWGSFGSLLSSSASSNNKQRVLSEASTSPQRPGPSRPIEGNSSGGKNGTTSMVTRTPVKKEASLPSAMRQASTAPIKRRTTSTSPLRQRPKTPQRSKSHQVVSTSAGGGGSAFAEAGPILSLSPLKNKKPSVAIKKQQRRHSLNSTLTCSTTATQSNNGFSQCILVEQSWNQIKALDWAAAGMLSYRELVGEQIFLRMTEEHVGSRVALGLHSFRSPRFVRLCDVLCESLDAIVSMVSNGPAGIMLELDTQQPQDQRQYACDGDDADCALLLEGEQATWSREGLNPRWISTVLVEGLQGCLPEEEFSEQVAESWNATVVQVLERWAQ